jgi:hypothetical protein
MPGGFFPVARLSRSERSSQSIREDAEHHLIVAHEVTNSGSDRAQLANMAKQPKAVLKTKTLEAVADRGCFSSRKSSRAMRQASR